MGIETDNSSTEKSAMEWNRAFFHAGVIGVLAIVVGQILPFSEKEKIAWAERVGWTLTCIDVLVRIPVYHYFVKGRERETRPWRVRVKKIFLVLEAPLLRFGLIREENEREFPTTVVHATLGILLSIGIGLPFWAVVPAVLIFGFGDPAARLSGVRFKGKLVWEQGTKKTWAGVCGYFYVGSFAGLFTAFLQPEYPLYPLHIFSPGRIAAAVIVTAAVGAFFESMCEKDGTWFSKMFDDNLVVPFVGSVAFYAVATAGV
jgi:dolichol kinase